MNEMVNGQHNLTARKEQIKDVCRKLQNLTDERDGINADIRELKNSVIKGDLGMKLSDFNIAFRFYQLETDDRTQLLDTIQECFEALGVGDQLDFVKAMEKPEPETEAAPAN